MKKNVAVVPTKARFSLIDENLLKSLIYNICGLKKFEMFLTCICKLCVL